MLVLTRRVGEAIQVGDGVLITVVRISDGSVRLGVQAPKEVTVFREELLGNPPAPAATDSSESLLD